MRCPEVVTFGCRLNAYESEIIRTQAIAAGFSEGIIFNTCAVTGEAERQARQAIRRARRKNPQATIVVTGCAAQIDPDRFAQMPEVDRVLGNQEKLERESFSDASMHRVVVNDIMAVQETSSHLISGFGERVRAFVQAQNGCDHRCTFCIIPFARGPSRSVPLGILVDQVRSLVEDGYKEVVLTGVDLGHYGVDLPGTFGLGDAVRRLIVAVPELPRIRLSSIDPVAVDDSLERLFAEERRLMPHLHLSVQSGDDLLLKRMKRRHSRDDVIMLCKRLRGYRPSMVFGADLIAGFPTETTEMHENSLQLIKEAGLVWSHIFPYSVRSGTPAARMPQVPVSVRRERASELRAAAANLRGQFLKAHIGQNHSVLLESACRGRSETFAVVEFPGKAGDLGTIVRARIDGKGNNCLLGARI